MSKAKTISKLIKFIISIFVSLVKFASSVIPYVLRTLFNGISKRLRFSITFKATTIYAFIFSLVFLVLSIVIVSSFGFFLLYESKNFLEKSGRVALVFLKESDAIPRQQLESFAKNEGISIVLLDKQKNVIYNTDDNNDLPVDIVNSPDEFNITSERIYLSIQNQGKENMNYILLSKSIIREKLYLLVLSVILTASFLLAVLFMVITGWRTIRKMLKPIDNMITTARTVSANRLHERINVVDSHDELKELAETFNEMLDRIQVSYEQQNQFVSDASHELRTPISVVQGYANLLQRWGKEEKEVLEESVMAIKNEADNMNELVERLLFLARADKDTNRVEKRPFSLNELVEEIVRETRMIDSEHLITGETSATIDITADRGLIKQALRIFVDNSSRYTPPGGTIKITGELTENRAIIIVEDNGIGISKEDIPLVFNRFYKCDKSRTRQSGGTGLGLSIAKWIIEKHAGKINIESALNRGTKIIIKLPLS